MLLCVCLCGCTYKNAWGCICGLGLYFIVCVCVCAHAGFFKHTEQRGPEAKMLCFNCVWFCGDIEGISSLEPRRRRERHTSGIERKKEGDKILLTMFCIHLNLHVLHTSSKALTKGDKKGVCSRKSSSKTLNRQIVFFLSFIVSRWALAHGTERWCEYMKVKTMIWLLLWYFRLLFLYFYWLLWHSPPKLSDIRSLCIQSAQHYHFLLFEPQPG